MQTQGRESNSLTRIWFLPMAQRTCTGTRSVSGMTRKSIYLKISINNKYQISNIDLKCDNDQTLP